MQKTCDPKAEKVDSSARQQTIVLISRSGGRYEVDKETLSQIGSYYYNGLVKSGMRDANSNELEFKGLSNRCLAEVCEYLSIFSSHLKFQEEISRQLNVKSSVVICVEDESIIDQIGVFSQLKCDDLFSEPGIYYKNSASRATTGYRKRHSDYLFGKICEYYSQLKMRGNTLNMLKLKPLKNIEEGLKGASFLQIKSMTDHYSALLLKHLSVQTCLRILQFASEYNLGKVLETVLDYWLDNFKLVTGSSRLLLQNALYRLARADVVNADREFDVFNFIVKWLSADESRRCHAEKLLNKVRYHLMTTSTKQKCHDILDAQNFNSVNINQEDANSSRSVGVLLSLGAATQMNMPFFFHSLTVYDLVRMTREKRRNQGCVSRNLINFRACEMPGPPLNWLSYQVCILDSSLYLAGKLNEGIYFSSQVYVYDLIKSIWKQCCNMIVQKALFYFDKIAGHLYAVSGLTTKNDRTHVVEKYVPEEDQWYTLTCLPVAVSDLTGCVLKGVMYVSGGNDGKRFLRDVYSYDPSDDVWERMTPLRTARCCHIMTSLGNKLLVLGGKLDDRLHHKQYVMDGEMYEFETDQWTSVLRLIKPAVHSPFVLINSCLYIFKIHTLIFNRYRNYIQKINLTKYLKEDETSVSTVENKNDLDNDDDECQLYEYCLEIFGSPMIQLCLYFK